MADDTPPPQNVSAGDADALDALRAQLAAAQQEVQRFKELAARSQADVQNARTRMEREAADARQYAAAMLILRLLPTIDSFQRAFAHVPADLQSHEWVKGIGAIERQMMKELTDAGLARMSSLGQAVDPARHEVLMTGPGAAGTVVEVFEEGYELRGKILRPAKVRVGEGMAKQRGQGDQ
ncbi:MAG: molecular chaperone GrpE [Candidatus Peregrinibacteria bacterium Gr01-1014_25]|nr:MAG: molecular chaperone GrpE [Candidatus Peregrinibacteria bacterium Gr01-1014_25]